MEGALFEFTLRGDAHYDNGKVVIGNIVLEDAFKSAWGAAPGSRQGLIVHIRVEADPMTSTALNPLHGAAREPSEPAGVIVAAKG